MKARPAALILTLAVALPASGAEKLQRLDLASIDLSRWSNAGQMFMEAADDGCFGRTEHFILRAATPAALEQLAAETEHAYAFVTRMFPVPPVAGMEEPARLIMVSRASTWSRFTQQYQLRADGLAIQIGREIYLKDDPRQQVRPDRIAHEIVHVRLHECYGEAVPLWLEEGLAGFFGWACAEEFQARHGMKITRTPPAFTEADLMAFEEFIGQDRYPRDPARTRVFYRQGEALVASLVEHLGRNDLHRFVARWCETPDGEDPLARFRHASGVDPAREHAIIEGMQQRFLSSTSSF